MRAGFLESVLCVGLLISCSSFVREQGESKPRAELFDLSLLRAQGHDWNVLVDKAGDKNGVVVLHHDKWLMYFLHWRALTKDLPLPSLAYARKLLLSFWGPSMPFKLSGTSGETKICGHDAFFVEGTLFDAVRTRFIVWNCPASKRQFIADCNINTRTHTPEHLFEWQHRVTEGCQCHHNCPVQKHPRLTRRYGTEKLNLALALPAEWSTAEFEYKKFYPDGVSAQRGSLWSLPTDSEILVFLFWYEKGAIKQSQQHLWDEKKLEIDANSFLSIKSVELRNVIPTENNDVRIAKGRMTALHQRNYPKKTQTRRDYRFRTHIWQVGSKEYVLLIAMVDLKKDRVMNMAANLTPTPDAFERVVRRVLQSLTIPLW